jgi:dihydrofolate reductase
LNQEKSISLIAAMSRNRVIGAQGKIPWHLPADLQHFKKTTLHHTIIMGRKTFESMGKALPKRQNVIVTRQANYQANDCLVANSLEQALASIPSQQKGFVIGGGELYEQALSIASEIILTMVDLIVEGDVFFPTIDEKIWKLASEQQHPKNEQNTIPFVICHYKKTL